MTVIRTEPAAASRGRSDARSGVSFTDCPFPEDSPLGEPQDWRKAWLQTTATRSKLQGQDAPFVPGAAEQCLKYYDAAPSPEDLRVRLRPEMVAYFRPYLGVRDLGDWLDGVPEDLQKELEDNFTKRKKLLQDWRSGSVLVDNITEYIAQAELQCDVIMGVSVHGDICAHLGIPFVHIDSEHELPYHFLLRQTLEDHRILERYAFEYPLALDRK